jgi:hypothetical protein
VSKAAFSAERVAKNNATFREANNRLGATARKARVEPAPFVCECADGNCMEIVMVPLAEYERVRSEPRWFVTVPGHPERAGEDVEVIDQRGAYVIVAKVGEAGRIVEELGGEQ